MDNTCRHRTKETRHHRSVAVRPIEAVEGSSTALIAMKGTLREISVGIREIFVCCTFREFDGGPNAQISERFLEGLRQQTYTNFRLIVTSYREEHVRDAIATSGLKHQFHQSDKRDCLYSWTEIIANSFQYLKQGENIILWTYTDLIFEPNYFEEVVRNFTSGIGGTSYPQITYTSLEDFENGIATDFRWNRPLRSFYQLDPNYWVPDTGWIDGDIFLDAHNKKLFLEHEFLDFVPGRIHSLAFAFFADRLVNLIHESKIAVIKNVRSDERVVKELAGSNTVEEDEAVRLITQHYWTRAPSRKEAFRKLCEARKIPMKFRSEATSKSKLHIHKEYKALGRIDQRLMFRAYFAFWNLNHSVRAFTRSLNRSIFARVLRRSTRIVFRSSR